MGSYVNSGLQRGEKVLYEGQVSLPSMMFSFLFAAFFIFFGSLSLIGGLFMGVEDDPSLLFSLIFLLFGGFILLRVFIRYKTTELAITDKRLVAKFGLIQRNTIETTLSKVESVQVDQGIMGRMLNYGTLIVSGAGNPSTPIPGISKPMAFKNALASVQDKIAQG